MSISLAIVPLLVLAVEFLNSLTDIPNAVATVISTRRPFALRVIRWI